MSHTAVNAIAYHTHVVDVSFVETEGQRPTLTSFVFRNSLNVAITRPYAFRIPCCLGVVDELEDPGYGMLGLPVCANSTPPRIDIDTQTGAAHLEWTAYTLAITYIHLSQD